MVSEVVLLKANPPLSLDIATYKSVAISGVILTPKKFISLNIISPVAAALLST